jgi:hypothetical protein
MNCYVVWIREDESSVIFVKPDSKDAARNRGMGNNCHVTEPEVSKSLTENSTKSRS